MSSSKSALIVGLGGTTASGKTTMCKSLECLFSSEKYNLHIKSLHMDDYYRSDDDPHQKYLEKFNQIDWDCLDAIDTDQFLIDLQSLCLTCDILLVEGFLIFNIPSLWENHQLFDLAYYFDLPYEECRQRRSRRDSRSPLRHDYFEKHAWHAHIKAKKEAFEQNKDIGLEIVDTTKESFEKIQDKIIKDIETVLKHYS
ncbi:unnamed protein product [Adineta steineri]|uniref:Uncharacterized protein n=1 Tax=Adineta steineri TaxID=433720 RepID=A0A813M4F7_9BILA|nr:unnamed protein product [Adineta steineri]CAF3733544.1 unnamed protein product [Adineta steineri]